MAPDPSPSRFAATVPIAGVPVAWIRVVGLQQCRRVSVRMSLLLIYTPGSVAHASSDQAL